MMRLWCVTAALMVMAAALPAQASFTMWFGDATGASVDQVTLSTPGETFSVRLWMSQEINAVEGAAGYLFSAAVGIDRSTSGGTGAVPIDNKIALATGSVNTDAVWGSGWTTDYDSQILKDLRGFQGTGTRPYGVNLVRDDTNIDAGDFSNRLVATLNLKGNMSAGENYTIVLYDAGSGEADTTFVMDEFGTVYNGVSDSLQVSVIPEPISLVLLGLGGLFMRRI